MLSQDREVAFESLLSVAEPRVMMLARFASISTRITNVESRLSELNDDTGTDDIRNTKHVTVGLDHAVAEANAGQTSVLKMLRGMYVGNAGPSEAAWEHFLQLVVVRCTHSMDVCSAIALQQRCCCSVLCGRSCWSSALRTSNAVCRCGCVCGKSR